MATASDQTYAGDKVIQIPFDPALEPFKIVLGHLPGNPRRLVQVLTDQVRSYFRDDEAQQLRVLLK